MWKKFQEYRKRRKEYETGKNKQQKSNGGYFWYFFLGECEFALNAMHFQEVSNAPHSYTSVPLAPNFLQGLFNLRGSIIPVVNLSKLLNIESNEASGSKKIAIIEYHESCIGLLFDRTGEVIKCGNNEKNDFGSYDESIVVSGVIKKDSGKRIIQILDVFKLFQLKKLPIGTHQSRLSKRQLELNHSGLKVQRFNGLTRSHAKICKCYESTKKSSSP